MRRDQFDVLAKFPAIDFVLDSVVREMNLIIEVRQVVLARPVADFVLVAAGSTVAPFRSRTNPSIAVNVAGVIEPALQAAETARSAGRPTNDLTAYDLYLRAYAMTLSSAARVPEALRLMKQVIERLGS